MSPRRVEKPEIPFNKAMFRWAREWAQRTYEEVAQKLHTAPEKVEAWENEDDDAMPTIRQARLLAEFYQRSVLEFFLREKPAIEPPTLVPDFRLYHDAGKPRELRELQEIQAWAEEQRLNALDLYDALDEEPRRFPRLRATLDDDAEEFAERTRKVIGLTDDLQFGLRANERDRFPKILRTKFEEAGVLVLKDSGLGKLRARGLCLSIFPLPVIVFGNEAPSAQAFTLAHEFGHLLLRESAISGPPIMRHRDSKPVLVENWCNRFAAAFLVTAASLRQVMRRPANPMDLIDDDQLVDLARRFKVSPHAMLIRLVHLHYVKPEFYWDQKREAFLRDEREYKAFGRAEYYGSRYRAARGDLYTSLVLEAWEAGQITNHNAAEFMGIKNLQHLYDVREHFTPE